MRGLEVRDLHPLCVKTADEVQLLPILPFELLGIAESARGHHAAPAETRPSLSEPSPKTWL